MQLSMTLGNILDAGMKESDLCMPPCNDCNMSWYRDLSMFMHGMRSIPILLESFGGARNFI
jgi:hypothetical protein